MTMVGDRLPGLLVPVTLVTWRAVSTCNPTILSQNMYIFYVSRLLSPVAWFYGEYRPFGECGGCNSTCL